MQKPVVSSVIPMTGQVIRSLITDVSSYCSRDLLFGCHILVLIFVIFVPK